MEQNPVTCIRNNIAEVAKDSMFRSVPLIKSFKKEVEQEVVHWLCASVWNVKEEKADYLDRSLAMQIMRIKGMTEE